MSKIIQKIEKEKLKLHKNVFKSGDTLKIHSLIKEAKKQRIQIFEGICIAKHNNHGSSTITVRKISFNYGVERIFPLASPAIKKIEVISLGKIRRAKLYYLRQLSGKKARIKQMMISNNK